MAHKIGPREQALREQREARFSRAQKTTRTAPRPAEPPKAPAPAQPKQEKPMSKKTTKAAKPKKAKRATTKKPAPKAKRAAKKAPAKKAAKPQREGTVSAMEVGDFICRPEGASMAELVAQFGIEAHPMRAKIHRCRHDLGYTIDIVDGRYGGTAPEPKAAG